MLQNVRGTATIRKTCLVLILALCPGACGLLGSKGEEPKGDAFLPLSGVGPYMKEDQDCTKDFLQTVFMYPIAPRDKDDVDDKWFVGKYWGEPLVLSEGDGWFRLFLEERDAHDNNSMKILEQRFKISSAPPGSCRTRDILTPDGLPIKNAKPKQLLNADGEDWTGGGAPSVIYAGGIYKIWYGLAVEHEGEEQRVIGYAEFIEDEDGNLVMTHQEDEPFLVLRPTDGTWDEKYVGSPSVLWSAERGVFQMWYEGSDLYEAGSFCTTDQDGKDICSRSIGYAESNDGKNWVKREAPVLTPSQPTWEFHFPEWQRSGTIGMPHVILHQSPVRTLYYMYYTGNLEGRPDLPELWFNNTNTVDTSIGFAGSLDGISWTKSSTIQQFGDIAWEVNPILNEIFPIELLQILNAICPKLIEDFLVRIEGSSNVFLPPLIVDEMAPSALDMGTSFLMFVQQSSYVMNLEDPVNLVDLFKPIPGLVLAIVERAE